MAKAISLIHLRETVEVSARTLVPKFMVLRTI
jgi:hypothetical protein